MSRRQLSMEEQRQRMLQKCADQLTMLQAAQARLQTLTINRPEFLVSGQELAVAHSAHIGSVHVGAGSFACVWASKHSFDDDNDFHQQSAGSCMDSGGEDTEEAMDQDFFPQQPGHLPFHSALKVLQLPIGEAKNSIHWPLDKLRNQTPLANRNLDLLYTSFDELRWQRLFIQEAEAMVACHGHPVVARVIGWCLDDHKHLPTLVMEYAGCANLWHTLFGSSRPRPHAGPLPVHLTWKQATAIYLQLLEAVDWMQNRLSDPAGRFCVHRDISPGNIVISWPQGRGGLPQIKLVDFGLSELLLQDDPDQVEWLQQGVAVGPDIMFIDPLMWVLRKFGKGTDIFGMAHILLLLMFGMHAAHNHGRSSASSGRDEEYNAICRNRATLRDVLRLGPKGALEHSSFPLLPRWKDCPTPLLDVLSRQCVLCTTAGVDAMTRRPSTRQLLSELSLIRSSLPHDLAAWLPTPAQLSAGIWPPPLPIKPSVTSTLKKSYQ